MPKERKIVYTYNMCTCTNITSPHFESTLFTRRITKRAYINRQRGSPPRQRAPVNLKMLLRSSKHSPRIKGKDQRRGGGEKRPMGYKVSSLKAPSPKEKKHPSWELLMTYQPTNFLALFIRSYYNLSFLKC